MRGYLKVLLAVSACVSLAACPAPEPLRSLPKAPDGIPGAITAFGHQPAWNLQIDRKEWRLISAEAGWDVMGKTPAGERIPDGWKYVAEDAVIMLKGGLCIDAVTGERYLDTLRVEYAGQTLEGCGGRLMPPADLNGTSWRGKKQLPGADDLIPRTYKGDIAFADGTMTGATGCNRFSADYRVEAGMLIPGPIVITKRACDGLDAKFERRFIETMAGPARIDFARDGSIVFIRHTGPYEWVGVSFEPAD